MVVLEISLLPQGQDTSIRSEPTGGNTPTTPAPAPAPQGETRQPASTPGKTPNIGDACMQQLPIFIPIILVMYFLMIRPQQKQEKARREMLAKVQKGDRVVTNTGLHGVVANVGEDTIQLFIDTEGQTKVTVDRSAIGRVVDREAAAKANGAGKS
ncbi:MAG: preprotein translocase subunit YajC [Planctomycetota bacterium]